MTTKPIKLYWSASKPNVGDWLSPLIVAEQTSRPITHAVAKKCELMSIGSILHKAKNHWWSPVRDIWGSGFIQDQPPQRLKHRIHAVRGRLTRERILNDNHIALGDPGLLVSKALPQYVGAQKKFKLGLVPHYEDYNDPQVKRFIEKHPEVKLINILNEVDNFVDELTQCEFILSSSLHGLIMADSFGIPNQWLVLSDKVVGNNFKFYDYYSVFDITDPTYFDLDSIIQDEIERVKENYARPNLAEVQQSLVDAFPKALK